MYDDIMICLLSAEIHDLLIIAPPKASKGWRTVIIS